MIQRSEARDTPWDPAALIDVAHLIGTSAAKPILASGQSRPHQQAEHMDAIAPITAASNPCKHGAVHIRVPAFAGMSGFCSSWT